MDYEQAIIEELHEFLDSRVQKILVNLIQTDIEPRKNALLTSLTLGETKRIADVSRIAAYQDLVNNLYATANRKVPPSVANIFN